MDIIMNGRRRVGDAPGVIGVSRQSLRGRHKTAKQKGRNAAAPYDKT
jgi:hypothetical protein